MVTYTVFSVTAVSLARVSVDCLDRADVSLGSEPSPPLPVRFIRPPQMLNARRT
jgi:hypothetical protein